MTISAPSSVASAQHVRTAGRATRLIAVEEAFMTPEIVAEAARVAGGLSSMRSGPIAGPFMADLYDLGAGRIAGMDAAGVDVQLLAVSAPGVQHFDDATAVALARDANDALGAAVAAHPDRLVAMTTVAPQAAEAAAAEIERTVGELGFRGVMVNSHTRDRYLDEPEFWPVLEAAEHLDVPIYLHPRDPARDLTGSAVPGFTVGWGFAVETGTHIVRLLQSGVLDRFPRLRIVVGHLGECVPFLLDRMDNRYPFEAQIAGLRPLPRTPGEYFRDHFWVATSGMNFAAPLHAVIEILGAERVLFAADHPMEDQVEAAEQFAAIPLTEHERELIAHQNAERLLGLG